MAKRLVTEPSRHGNLWSGAAPRRSTRDGRTDKKSLGNPYFTIFPPSPSLDPFLKELFNKAFPINSKGNPPGARGTDERTNAAKNDEHELIAVEHAHAVLASCCGLKSPRGVRLQGS